MVETALETLVAQDSDGTAKDLLKSRPDGFQLSSARLLGAVQYQCDPGALSVGRRRIAGECANASEPVSVCYTDHDPAGSLQDDLGIDLAKTSRRPYLLADCWGADPQERRDLPLRVTSGDKGSQGDEAPHASQFLESLSIPILTKQAHRTRLEELQRGDSLAPRYAWETPQRPGGPGQVHVVQHGRAGQPISRC